MAFSLILPFVYAGILQTAWSVAATSEPLPRPPALEPAVAFWTEIFTLRDEDDVVFFDEFHMDRVYEIRRLPPQNGTRHRERLRESLRARWKQSLIDDLKTLAKPGVDYDQLEGRLYRIYGILGYERDPDAYRDAAENLRSQRGHRTNFLDGVTRSARYLDVFKKTFREEGLPPEIAYLPHVESSFRSEARSGVGALGMWQFMSRTARKYMIVDSAVDERLDPYTAARAAARYLKVAYAELGNWPLAITSYNHGVDGIKNAVRETGTTDIARIVGSYRGPLFGFAGRNFYPELLAAIDAAEHVRQRLEPTRLDTPVAFDTFQLPAYVKLATVSGAFNVDKGDLVALNPAIRASARRGDLYLSKGFSMKLPPGAVSEPEVLFAGIPAAHRPVKRPQRTYRIRSGDSLGTIASKFKTSVGTLQRLNGIRNPNRVRAGAVLKLPH